MSSGVSTSSTCRASMCVIRNHRLRSKLFEFLRSMRGQGPSCAQFARVYHVAMQVFWCLALRPPPPPQTPPQTPAAVPLLLPPVMLLLSLLAQYHPLHHLVHLGSFHQQLGLVGVCSHATSHHRHATPRPRGSRPSMTCHTIFFVAVPHIKPHRTAPCRSEGTDVSLALTFRAMLV